MIDLIKVDNEFVYIAISGFFGSSEERETPAKPILIIDKLTKTGSFENDLFEK